ncbi:MAG: hypothetical protein AB8B91_20100 [Rubripirellula sp.]
MDRQTFVTGVCVCLLLGVSGCMPETQAPVVKGTLETNNATQLQSRIRSANAPKFSVEHQLGDKTFTANWEISNSMKKSSQLQIKPPKEGWLVTDLYQALDVVLQAHDTKPWYGQIDETVLRLMTRAAKEQEGIETDMAPDSPYKVSVKVREHTTEWFLEVKVIILNEDGSSIGI